MCSDELHVHHVANGKKVPLALAYQPVLIYVLDRPYILVHRSSCARADRTLKSPCVSARATIEAHCSSEIVEFGSQVTIIVIEIELETATECECAGE